MIRSLLLSCLMLPFAFALSHSADWSRFRGPNGSGVAEGTMPKLDPAAPLWKVKLPGRGASSPIIAGGKIFVQSASTDGMTRSLICLNAATGKTIWSSDHKGEPAPKQELHAKNSLASSTPASDGDSIYCVWYDGSAVSLNSYDLTGKEKWRASLGGWKSQHGPGSSPVVHGGLVFVNVDDDERAELVAFDAKTGDKRWLAQRKKQRACYASPYVLKRGDKPEELILGTTHAITSYEPSSGKVNWEFQTSWPKGQMPLRVIGHPVYAGGLLVMGFGDGGGARYMIAVNPDGEKPRKVWEISKEAPYVPCILVKEDLLFWINDPVSGGMAVCAEAKTGKILFHERVTTKPPSSSPVMVGNEILTIDDDGTIVVFKAAKELDVVKEVKLGEGVFASPALADGRLYIRGITHLYCFGKP